MNTIRNPFAYLPDSPSAALDVSDVSRICPLPTAVVRTRPARGLVRLERKVEWHHSETWYGANDRTLRRTEFWEAVLYGLLGASAAAGVAVALM